VAAAVEEFIRKALSSVPAIACTADAWSDGQRRKVVGVTAHWLTEEWKMMSVVLGMDDLDSGRAISLRDAIENVLSRFQVGEKPFLIGHLTTDQEAAMRLARAMLMGDASDCEDCFAHVLQCVVHDVTECADEPCGSALQKMRAIISSVRLSPNLVSELKTVAGFERCNTLISPAKTRWSSEFYCLDRFLPLYAHIVGVMTRAGKQDQLLSDAELEMLEALHVLLKPFEKVTRLCEGEKYATLAHVPSWVQSILDSCASVTGERLVKERIRSRLRLSATERLSPFITVSPERVPIGILAAALHPLYHKLEFLDETGRATVVRKLFSETILVCPGEEDFSSSDDDVASNSELVFEFRKLKKLFKVNDRKSPPEFIHDGALHPPFFLSPSRAPLQSFLLSPTSSLSTPHPPSALLLF
jgi:hypothetical protein